MEFFFFVKKYLEINILIGVSYLCCVNLIPFVLRWGRYLSPTQLLKICYISLIAVIMLPILFAFSPTSNFIEPAIQVWSASNYPSRIYETGALSISSFAGSRSTFSPQFLFQGLFIVMAGFILGGIFCLIRGYYDLYKEIKKSFLIRKVGRVSIIAIDTIKVPFSYWTPLCAYVAIPFSLLSDGENLRIAVLHELQHHRQKDTVWIHILELMKLIFCLNPFIYQWEKKISLLQEFACDEALIYRKRVSPRAYGNCLITVAEDALKSRRRLITRRRLGIVGMAESISRKNLQRRIEMMFQYRKKRSNRKIGIICSVLTFITLFTATFASQNLIKDHRITMEQAQRLVSIASENSSFPFLVNEQILEQLNYFLGTPEGRSYMNSAIARMDDYRSMIEGKTRAYALPEELLAIPIIESAYNPEYVPFDIGQGLWKFIKSTAINFGLEVKENKDERLDPIRETDAAMRYLGANYLRFQDWMLAILAYNAGEGSVQRGIEGTKSRNAWMLIKQGFEGDKNYLPKVIAAMIILKNPNILK